MPAPKKGPRFGGSAAHQKAMMANLAASLFAAEGIVTTEAKAKALRPYAEKLITKAKKGGLHRYRDALSTMRRGHVQQALPRDRSALRRPQRRLHPDPEARPPPGRQRPHGQDRVGLALTLFDEEDLAPAAPTGPSVRVRLLVAYDGSAFHGFAVQPGVKTVGGTLATTLARVLGHRVDLVCAGRTDAGVHGWGQVVSFDADAERFDAAKAQAAVNGLCGPAIVVREAGIADTPDFDARFDATARRYRYTVLNRPVPDPFLATTAWHVAQPLDLRAMQAACDPLIGEHDFTSFCRKPKGEADPSMTRRVLNAWWERDDAAGEGVLRFWIEATAFCHQMVRSVTGTLVDVGLGRRTAAEVMAALKARDRAAAGPVAPPHGLCLWEVVY